MPNIEGILKLLKSLSTHQLENNCGLCKECVEELSRACEMYLSNTKHLRK